MSDLNLRLELLAGMITLEEATRQAHKAASKLGIDVIFKFNSHDLIVPFASTEDNAVEIVDMQYESALNLMRTTNPIEGE